MKQIAILGILATFVAGTALADPPKPPVKDRDLFRYDLACRYRDEDMNNQKKQPEVRECKAFAVVFKEERESNTDTAKEPDKKIHSVLKVICDEHEKFESRAKVISTRDGDFIVPVDEGRLFPVIQLPRHTLTEEEGITTVPSRLLLEPDDVLEGHCMVRTSEVEHDDKQ